MEKGEAMTFKEKKKCVEKLSADDLFAAYETFRTQFNPLDEDFCESFEVIKAEIYRRVKAYELLKGESS